MSDLLKPFRGLRYTDCGDIGDLIAPPYDVIDADRRAELAARHPCNIVHLTLPEAPGDKYDHAARLLAQWRWRGGLRLDESPTVTVVQQVFKTPDGASHARTGLIGLAAAEPYETGRVRPHERTHGDVKEDRLRLLRATRTATESIFMVAPDPEGTLATFLGAVAGEESDAVTSLDGVDIRVWVVAEEEAAEVLAAVDRAPLYMADGHHRYETAVTHADELDGEGRIVTMVVPLSDPGLVVLATHRLIPGSPVDRDEALTTMAGARPAGPGEEEDCVLVTAGDRTPLILTDAAEGPTDLRIARVERAVVEQLHHSSAHDEPLAYSADEKTVTARVESGEAAAGVLVLPTPMSDVMAVADAGGVMPPKSTYFYPKVPSGLVLWPID